MSTGERQSRCVPQNVCIKHITKKFRSKPCELSVLRLLQRVWNLYIQAYVLLAQWRQKFDHWRSKGISTTEWIIMNTCTYNVHYTFLYCVWVTRAVICPSNWPHSCQKIVRNVKDDVSITDKVAISGMSCLDIDSPLVLSNDNTCIRPQANPAIRTIK